MCLVAIIFVCKNIAIVLYYISLPVSRLSFGVSHMTGKGRVGLRRRQSTTPSIESLHNGSQKLVLVSRRFAGIFVSGFDWLGFFRALWLDIYWCNWPRQLCNTKNKFLSRIEICFAIQNIKETVSDSFIYCIKCTLSCYRKESQKSNALKQMETIQCNHRNYLSDRPKTNTFVETVWQCSLGWRNDKGFSNKLENWTVN